MRVASLVDWCGFAVGIGTKRKAVVMICFYKRFALLVTVTFLFALQGNVIVAQGSQNVNMLANWDNPSLPNISGYYYNDVWGYAANGREYAFIGTNSDVLVFDVTIASSPLQLATLAGGSNASIWRDMKTYQNYLYAISDQGTGSSLQIFDLSGLPSSITKVYDSQAFFTTAHNLFVSENSARMYVAGANTQPNGVIMLDISNPAAPVQLASYTLGGYVHDVYAHNDTLYAFMGGSGISSFDLSSLSYPYQFTTLTSYSGQGYAHSGWADASNKYLYWADETHSTDVHILDIKDPWNVVVAGSFNSMLLAPTYTNSVAHNMMVRDSFLFISYYHDGLQIWNISNPASPVKYGHYDTYSNTDYSGTFGAWGIYTGLPSGNILVSDTRNGLFVLQTTVNFPVTLSSFEALPVDGDVHLEWTTEAEVNSERFDLERSVDGTSFEKIGSVNAAGHSNERINYRFIDSEALEGQAYYRLRQFDFDGQSTLSEIRMVNSLASLDFVVFPNPVGENGTAQIRIDLPVAKELDLVLTDMLGRIISRDHLSLHSGSQVIALPSANLRAGSYHVRIEGEGIHADKSFIVTR